MPRNSKRRIPAQYLPILILLTLVTLFTSCARGEVSLKPAAVYPVHTQLQKAYLLDDAANILLYADGTKEKSHPLPVTLDLSGTTEEYTEIEYCESADFHDSFYAKIQDGYARIYNLKTGAVYYYRGVSKKGKGTTLAFQTEEALPRNLMIEGVTNARDLGGYQTPTGKIKQGMLYRTARLNQNKADAPSPIITENGITTMLENLHIKTEIDLRRTSDNEIGSLTASVLGETVNYQNCPMVSTSDMLTANSDSIRKVFSLLAEEKNYPLFYHCSIGTDRTGYISFLILSLLGVARDDVYRDYLFSDFASIGSERTILNVAGFSFFLSLKPGNTPAEQAENFLLEIGVTKEEIQSVRRILIE